jgi:hypothetical protein
MRLAVRRLYLSATCLLLLWVPKPSLGHAQAKRVQVAVFPVALGSATLRDLAAALDPVLLSSLHELAQLEVTTRPALDLAATQLAVDCVGQTRECLRVISRQSGAEGLVAPSLQIVGQETVMTLLYFDGRGDGDMRTISRRYSGPAMERQALDDVPSMIRELFGLPEPERSPPAPALDSSFGGEFDATGPKRTVWPALPVVLTATGVVLVAVGAGFGVAAEASERRYREIQVDTVANREDAMREADRARDKLSAGRTQATLCNIGLAVGGAALVTGVTLWVLHAVKPAERRGLAVVPTLSPGNFGISLQGSWGMSSQRP